MTSEVIDALYLAGDLSGVQRFVLRVMTAGESPGETDSARSFLLKVLEHAALRIIQHRFEVSDDDDTGVSHCASCLKTRRSPSRNLRSMPAVTPSLRY